MRAQHEIGTHGSPDGRPYFAYPAFGDASVVGPTDEAASDNTSGDSILQVPELQFDTVLDFGCGCGRLARQMMQQRVRPRRYVGFDLHFGMVRWCQENLAPKPRDSSFSTTMRPVSRSTQVWEAAYAVNAVGGRGVQPSNRLLGLHPYHSGACRVLLVHQHSTDSFYVQNLDAMLSGQGLGINVVIFLE